MNEYIEINNIIALAKADGRIKQMVIEEFLKEFWGDFEVIFKDYFSTQGEMRAS